MSLAADANPGPRTMPCLAAILLFAGLATPSLAVAPRWQVAKLHSFSGGKNGGNPFGPLIADPDGNIYGTTETGGTSGYGVVFELSRSSDGSWSDTTLHRFRGSDGAYPYGGLVIDSQGNLYGTTFSGGDQSGGVAFELSPTGKGGWSYSVINQFSGPNSQTGSNPNGNLAFDNNGNLYGTTQLGGATVCTNFQGPCGVVYELTPAKGGGWVETVLYSFGGPPDGSFPYSPLILDSAGNVYGTTSEGGTGNCKDQGIVIGCGTVFELKPSRSGWSETMLYNFRPHEFGDPGSPLVFGTDGSLYSTAGYDIFQLEPGNGTWTKSTIYEFTEGIAGTIPSGGVVFDADGNLFGTTASSGLEGYSTVFKLSPSGSGAWTEKTLARFGNGLDSKQPRGSVLIGGSGTLFGAANSNASSHGYVFAVTR